MHNVAPHVQDEANKLILAGQFRKAKELLATSATTVGFMGGGSMLAAQPGFPGAKDVPYEPDVGSMDVCAPESGGGTKGQRPYVFSVGDPLAAGALTAGTEIVDFYDSAQSNDITSNNIILRRIKTFSARMFVGVRANTDLGIENEGLLASLYIREIHNDQEIARYPCWKLGLRYSVLGTSTATSTGGGIAAFSGDIAPIGVKWSREFDPNSNYSKQLHVSVGFTTIEILDLLIQYNSRVGARFTGSDALTI